MSDKFKKAWKAISKTATRDVTPIELLIDYSEAISSIERDLNAHQIGTFRVNVKNMEFKWKDLSL